jgi:HAD superfamily hydrolase (TIGR01509 family)
MPAVTTGRQGRPYPVGIVPGVREDSPSGTTPPSAVLFDFHGTLVQVEDPVVWVREAAAACGRDLDPIAVTALADRFVAAGRAGGPPPHRIPPHLAEVYAERDLYEHAHRAAYVGLAETVQTDVAGLPTALYERLLTPDGWLAYRETRATLAELHARGVPVAVVSNVGFDIRPVAEALGFAGYVDAYVLSYEVGRLKPDPAVFVSACVALGVEPEDTLMVGDTPADAGAVAAGCRAAYVLATAPPGTANGLAAVLRLLRG